MGCINIPELQKMTEKSQKMNGKSTFTNLITYRALSSFSDVFPAVSLQPSRQFGTGIRVFAVSLGVHKTILRLMNPIVQTLSNLDVNSRGGWSDRRIRI